MENATNRVPASEELKKTISRLTNVYLATLMVLSQIKEELLRAIEEEAIERGLKDYADGFDVDTYEFTLKTMETQ